jgi:dTDP-4-amino-4,6-dideoxygalactose transaminase
LGHCFTERTRAVITVHQYDQISEIDAILETGKKKAVAVVEDCAHAHGARWRGRGVGTFGALGTFSFQQHKSLTCGEGGSVTTQDLSLADRVYALKDCGRQRVAGSAIGFGGNYRISEFQAAILNAQLERLPEQLALKVTRLSQLRNHLNDVRGIDMLPHKENVTRPGSYMIALRYDPTEFDGLARELLIEAMQAEGIPLIPPYEVVYASDLWRSGVGFLDLDEPEHALGLGANCPVAEDISRRTGLALPQSLLLGSEQDVVDVIRAFAKVKRHITALLKRGRRRNRSRQLRQFFKRTP